MFRCGEFQLGFGAYWHLRADGMLEVGIQTLLRIQFRAIAWQVEELDLVLALCRPSFHRLAVMHPQVVENQKYLLAGILDQGFEELDELVRVVRRSRFFGQLAKLMLTG